MFGIALEGGGAKGAFHMGAVKALLEHGYKIEGAVGTSIGAFNAALISQGDFETAYEFWMNIGPSDLFDIDDEKMRKLLHNEYDLETIRYFSGKTKQIIFNKGIEVHRLRETVETYVSEEKLRNSSSDYGLVTVSLSDLKPMELYKEQIPEGKLYDFIMASANFPGFKSEGIDEKQYIDGGVYNNCPVNLLIDKGYDEVFAIRTAVRDKMRNVVDTNAVIVNVTPSEDLGSVLIFDQALIRKNIKMGYYDTLRHIKGLLGRKYYITPKTEDEIFSVLGKISTDQILSLGRILRIPEMESKRMLFERIIPSVCFMLKLSNTASYQEIILGLLEELAQRQGIDRFKVYDFDEFVHVIEESRKKELENVNMEKGARKKTIMQKAVGLLGESPIEEVASIFLETYKR